MLHAHPHNVLRIWNLRDVDVNPRWMSHHSSQWPPLCQTLCEWPASEAVKRRTFQKHLPPMSCVSIPSVSQKKICFFCVAQFLMSLLSYFSVDGFKISQKASSQNAASAILQTSKEVNCRAGKAAATRERGYHSWALDREFLVHPSQR